MRTRAASPAHTSSSPLARWSAGRIDAECAQAYRAYHRDLRDRHIKHFADTPKRRDARRPFVAASFDDALPVGWGTRLARLIKPDALHRHYLSGGSSQTLALGLLGPAVLHPSSLQWLFEPGGPFPSVGVPLTWQFEYSVGFGLLNETPHTTDIDFLVSGPRGVLAVEAKFMEKGFGRCSCSARAQGRCDARIVDDRPYWKIARSVLGLMGPSPPDECELGLAYQPVRNLAAALEMTGLRDCATFGLLYDERNPYFAGCGEWPGWARLLERSVCADARVAFKAVSWQQLIPLLPRRGRREVRLWAADRHGLTSDL
jgi:hypothetical protein